MFEAFNSILSPKAVSLKIRHIYELDLFTDFTERCPEPVYKNGTKATKIQNISNSRLR